MLGVVRSLSVCVRVGVFVSVIADIELNGLMSRPATIISIEVTQNIAVSVNFRHCNQPPTTAGPVTTIDRSPWRFIKDCKLQRLPLPSVCVDLVFQQCNLDFELDHKVADEADAEFEPLQFVEGLVRLAYWRHNIGYEQTILEDVEGRSFTERLFGRHRCIQRQVGER